MNHAHIPLHRLKTGERGIVSALELTGNMRRRMLDLGMVVGTTVESLGRSPSGDPTAYLIRGSVIAVRAEDAAKISVKPIG